ncbi:PAS domain S-box protein [Hymenobacter humi]|uniref:histidine kinase n=1 Tax=Hymenobacter humi TaxID=1411620 RepID=A0ABW2UA79_9BACT
MSLLPVLTEADQLAGVYGIATPVPGPPTATEALVAREHQLSVIFNTIADVTFVLNVEEDGRYRFIFANKAFERTTGVPAEKVVGSYVDEVIPEPSLSMVLANYHQAVTTLERVIWQETSDYPTGRVTGEVSVTPVCDEAGRCFRLVGVVHDITKEKQAEEELRLSNERFAYALKATSDAIYDWNVTNDTLYWGEGFAHLFGYRLGQNPSPFSDWADYIHPKDSHRTVTGLLHTVYETTDTFWEDEYLFRRSNGSWAVVADRGNILRNAKGQAVRMIGAMQDITERKKAEVQQQAMAEKLIKQNAYLQQCGFMVSHNLRAPLANALGFADLLSRIDKESQVFADSLANLRISLRRLDDVVADVNTILSIRDQQDADLTEPVALAAVCRQALEHARPDLEQCGGEVLSSIPEALYVDGNRAFFLSIFDNLLSNAIKYRSAARPLRIEITASWTPGQGITINFRDNGSGFDQEQAGGDVFQLYRRLHADVPGRGIGLYLVKAHVEAMNGHVSVLSQVNVGTEFTLQFRPRADENLSD